MFLMLTLFTIFGGNMYLVISNLNIGRSISSSSSGWRQGLRFLYPLPDSFFLPCNWFFNIKSSPVDSSKQIIIPFSPPGLEIGRTLILVNESWGKVYLRFLENFSSLSFSFFFFPFLIRRHSTDPCVLLKLLIPGSHLWNRYSSFVALNLACSQTQVGPEVKATRGALVTIS